MRTPIWFEDGAQGIISGDRVVQAMLMLRRGGQVGEAGSLRLAQFGPS